MIKHIKNVIYPFGTNSYTVYDTESKNCLIIDLGGDFSKIIGQAESLGLKVNAVILTHGHIDHIQGIADCKKYNIPVYVSKEDFEMLTNQNNLSTYFGMGQFTCVADFILTEGEIEIGGIKVAVIKTPGHTEGSVSFIIGEKLYSGDTLFANSFGRTDFPTGNFSKLKDSIINKLFALDGNTEVFPGHEGSTTIERERKYNPINDY